MERANKTNNILPIARNRRRSLCRSGRRLDYLKKSGLGFEFRIIHYLSKKRFKRVSNLTEYTSFVVQTNSRV